MEPESLIDRLCSYWCSYLEERGHQILQSELCPKVIRSRDVTTGRFRWLLRAAQAPEFKLSVLDRACIRRHLRRAAACKERTFLVAGFTLEPRRIIVLPAQDAMRKGFVRSDKGGIAWDD